MKNVNRLRGHFLVRLVSEEDPKDTRIHYFSNNGHYCLLGECEDSMNIWYHNHFHHKLKKLHEHDQQHNSDNIRLLYNYLLYERRVTETANALNMHRNSVTYRISRIEDLLEVELDDLATRNMLIFSFYLLILYGFNPD